MSSTDLELENARLRKRLAACQQDFDELSVEVDRRNDALRAIAAQLSLADDTPMQELVDTALRVIDEGLLKILNDHRPVDLG